MATQEDFNYKQFTDPIHGSIGLSKAEIDVISTPEFQRLRRVKQLGQISLVFPAADYSRFAHSLGVCHVIGKFLDVLIHEDASLLSRKRIYRMAGLLHDIGHYPYSHTMETALKDVKTRELIQTKGNGTIGGKAELKHGYITSHEDLGAQVIEKSQGIANALREHDFDPAEISRIFRRQDPNDSLASLVSSDLDADRMDYLLRDSYHSGLPFGNVDIGYLVSRATLVNSQSGSQSAAPTFAFDMRAMRTIEHFLMARYFEYTQLVFNKACLGFEWLLTDVLSRLASEGSLLISAPELEQRFAEGTWKDLDDQYVHEHIRRAAREGNGTTRSKAEALLERRPPVHISCVEGFGLNESSTAWRDWQTEAIQRLAACGIAEDQIHFSKSEVAFIKSAHKRTQSVGGSQEELQEEEEWAESVLLKNPSDGSGTHLHQAQQSLIYSLRNKVFQQHRLYVLNGESINREDTRKKVKGALGDHLSAMQYALSGEGGVS